MNFNTHINSCYSVFLIRILNCSIIPRATLPPVPQKTFLLLPSVVIPFPQQATTALLFISVAIFLFKNI